MTSAGEVALQKYANGGIANKPQLALFGEGSQPEAYVPLPDGRTIPVTVNAEGGESGGSTNVQFNLINESGTPMSAQQKSQPRFDGKQMIVDVVLESASKPGPMRDLLKSMK